MRNMAGVGCSGEEGGRGDTKRARLADPDDAADRGEGGAGDAASVAAQHAPLKRIIPPIVAAPTLLVADDAFAAERKRKPTPAQQARQEAKTFCPYWKPIDMQRYKECMARSR